MLKLTNFRPLTRPARFPITPSNDSGHSPRRSPSLAQKLADWCFFGAIISLAQLPAAALAQQPVNALTPPPLPLPALPTAPIQRPPSVAFTNTPPDPQYHVRRTPRIEIWRNGATAGEIPQAQAARVHRIALAGNLNETVLVVLRLPQQFAGRIVTVEPLTGVEVQASVDQTYAVTLDARGDGVFTLAFAGDAPRGSLRLRLDQTQTILRVVRRPPQ